MPLTVLLAVLAVSLAVPAILWALFVPGGGGSGAQKQIQANLARGLHPNTAPAAAREPAWAEFTRKLTVPRNVALLGKLHAAAGRPAAWPLARVLAVKPVLAAVALLLALLLFGSRLSGPVLALIVFVTVIAYFLPELLLYSRGQERQTTIGLELPDTLDQMTIAVEAGLGFEAAMARAGNNGKGPLAEELVRTLQDMRFGMSRREAYLALGERVSVPDLKTFIRSVVQADAYGISISTVLRMQAQEMRLKRRQRAEEKAMQIPVKVLFPLMLFILPVLMIAVLGPTIINAIISFS
ncbi:type II secretion system F family protein [Cryobacterium sp. SO2]|uniref:type II secretion system F family protein n=1 Tax=Cryobacterium sp. SO2 TaxID=1897060 RepID=UPI00223DCB08|nr:type II secretion system F family protein [Cryobacterium sp. SO2]WEO78002.1 type II secretion system F family protein [Cryobacterium sp. SO2]